MQPTARAAFAFWEGRIAPVFDVARQVLLVDREPAQPEQRPVLNLADTAAAQKARLLLDQEARTLVCGAISRPLQDLLVRQGVQVLPFLGGDAEEVILAWRTGQLGQDAFLMPGCRARLGRRRQRNGQGKGGGMQGKMRRARQATDNAVCFCPRCGYRPRPTPDGAPCALEHCPRCHTVLVRT